jgi:hypothetical protein
LTAAAYASGVSDDAIHRQGDLVSHRAQYGFATTGGFVTPRQDLSPDFGLQTVGKLLID